MNTNGITKVKTILFITLGIIILAYSGFQAQKLIVGPQIIIDTPENGALYDSTLIEISGHVKNVSYLNLNDRKIFTDTNGAFKEKLLLSPGYNIIKLDAKDKFGKYTEKRLELVLKEY